MAVPARLLIDILKILPDQILTFDLDFDQLLLRIHSMSGTYKMMGEQGLDYPTIARPTSDQAIDLPADLMKTAIQYTLFAVSQQNFQAAITGLSLKIDDQGATFVATDGFRLVKYHRNDLASSDANHIILPKKALHLLEKALSKETTSVQLAYDETNAHFAFNNINLTCRLIEGRFPNYDAVIPTMNPYTMIINRMDFQIALKRILLFSNKTTYHIVLNIGHEEVKLYAQDIDFSNEATETVACMFNGPPMSIAFNAKFFIELLQVLQSEEIRLQLSNPNKAGVIIPEEMAAYEDLVMLSIPVNYQNT